MFAVYKRDPIGWLAAISAVIQLFSALLLPLDGDQQGALNAAAAVILGAIAAFQLSAERGIATIGAVVKGLIAVALAFGLTIAPEVQASIMVLVEAVVAGFLRTQVTAPVPPLGGPRA